MKYLVLYENEIRGVRCSCGLELWGRVSCLCQVR
ncbi:hypothetical protein SLEP1_g24691 [Rubroshorea leprosula]|uniref:Uncharacterized protein n=1 Tax=Rubroshorea leprosula TaxID=152421 RepID=A0AAV5JGD8_9ROSI|nr:hypothetical protein SLEP1_g24691 [Rubroshorea leprosula]